MIAYVEISVIAHATEDVNKVLQALTNTVPKEFSDEVHFVKQHTQGHYGNPITIIKARIKRRRQAEAYVRNLVASLAEATRATISSNLAQHLDEEGNLYIRLDKQKAYTGILTAEQRDPIRIRVRLNVHPRTINSLIEAYKSLGLIQ